ncbi:RHS repeat-associated core domain-containing protein [Microtetraspora malaysiensis]|uniref:RHS repeat-associated core domain-containing protein n=1 Tax=Microtetraspora malaysiensis TaxID=161358 RepID=UPI003D8ADFF0
MKVSLKRAALRGTVLGTVVVCLTGVLPGVPALADPEPVNTERPEPARTERPVKGRTLAALPRSADPAARPGPPPKADWPAGGATEVSVPGAGRPVRAGRLPVWILPSSQATTLRPAGKVRVSVLDKTTATRAGLDGLVLTLGPADAAGAGRVGVRVDYSSFAQAYGGAYGSRLRLVRLPGCVLTTPDDPGCRTSTPLPAANDTAAGTLTAEVEAAPGTVLMAAAGESGSQGDYKASSLSASATWEAGGNAGEFTWTYPMRVPPVPGGLKPEVELSYASGSVDGRTGNTNGQPSWVGQGFELSPGFIERRFKSCEDDGAPKDSWGNYPGDQCWGYDNATVSWNGKAGEVIKAADGTWRMKNDDGTKFEKLTGTTNGDDDGEYWRVTTTDGVQYFFGRNRLPGWADGKPETASAWTVPVFGDDDGEPCHKSSGFADSWCQQAYRWNLDYVVDRDGNAITYTYAKETNHYGRNLKADAETPYTRGGYLKSISYGLRSDALFATAPARVVFDTAERCLPDASFDCAPSKIADNPQRWWDVPWDLNCDSGQECKGGHGAVAPTFWSRKRLTKVTTQVIKDDGSGYRGVESWAMDHTWGLADVERDLLLDSIQHIGLAVPDGEKPVTLPMVTFKHVQLPNRLDKSGDDILAYIRYRLGAIYDESGGQIDIAYSDPDCTLDALPTPETNTRRCFPVIWQPPGKEDPITDWFHKYVVTSVTQVDRTGLAPNMVTKYEYLGGAAWHFDDDDGLTKEKHKTWSQWRGYGQVRTVTGDYTNPATQTDAFYLRGMDGDRLNKSGGEKSVTVSDGEGGTHPDHDALAGFELRKVQYTGPGGQVHSKAIKTPWRVQTASRTRSWGTVTANVVNADVARTWTAKDGGGWIETRIDTDYARSGPGVGRSTTVNDLGDVTTAADDKCTRTSYADNIGAHMVTFPIRIETVAVACTVTPDRSRQVISDSRTFYDNGAFGAAPTRGNVTGTEALASHDGTTATYVTDKQTTYDSYGRATVVKDALGQAATTVYTDTRGLTTKVAKTPPAVPGLEATPLTGTEEIDPAWGEPIAKIDEANRLRTDLAYDGLGRLSKVWQPNRSKASGQSPNFAFTYRVEDKKIVAITTTELTATGGERVSEIELLDGWLRSRQTQVPGPEGRLISDNFYDDRGQVVKSYAPYSATGAPQPELLGVLTPGNVEAQTRTAYDGLGRRTAEILMVGNGSQPEQEKWRTITSYGGGNRVSVTPPEGGIPTAEITDARGRVIERRQYHGSTPTGTYDATRYTYTPDGEQATVTGPAGAVWTTDYDQRGRKIKTTDPDKGETTYTYDDLDREISVTDARGKKVFTDYDVLGRKTATHEGSATGPKLTSYTYDSAAFGKGKLATSTRHTAGGDYTSQIRHYDQLGRADTTAVIVPAAEGALAGTYIFTTSYGLDETVTGQSLPAAGGLPAESLVTTYDDYLRPTRLTSNLGTYVAATDYTSTGKPLLYEMGVTGKRVWQTFTYEWGTQRLTTARTLRENQSGTDRDATYRYNDAGLITTIADASKTGTDTQCFAYDHLQRLTEAWTEGDTSCEAAPTAAVLGGPAPYWQSFTYDTASNRTSETRHGTSGKADTVRTYTYAPPDRGHRLNQVTQTGGDGARTDTYTYDATGNTITRAIGGTAQALGWGTAGELAQVTEGGKTTGFVYDAEGNRLLRKDSTGTTLYLQNTELRLNTGATTPVGTRYYSHGDETVAMRTTTGVTFLTVDHQDTAQVAVDAATQQTTVRRFTPFGTQRGPSVAWPGEQGFVGGTKDPTGLTHLGARLYDPDTGRFISVDPIFNFDHPQSWNGYVYANNTPITQSDPSGLDGPLRGNTGCYYSGKNCGFTPSPQLCRALPLLCQILNPPRPKIPNKVRNSLGPIGCGILYSCSSNGSGGGGGYRPAPRGRTVPVIRPVQPYETPPGSGQIFVGNLDPRAFTNLGWGGLGSTFLSTMLGGARTIPLLNYGDELLELQRLRFDAELLAIKNGGNPRYWSAYYRTSMLKSMTQAQTKSLRLAKFARGANYLGVVLAGVDNYYAQRAEDSGRTDLSGGMKTARAVVRGLATAGGALAGGALGTALCGPACAGVGGYLGAAAGSTAGAWAARSLPKIRKWFG